MRDFNESVTHLVKDGLFQYGNYKTFIDILNPLDAKLFHSLTPEIFKQSRLKEWHAFQFGDDRFFCFFVIMDLKITSLIQMTFYDKEKRRIYKRHITLPPMILTPLENMLNSSLFYTKDDVLIDLQSNLAEKTFRLNLSFKNEIDQLPVRIHLESKSEDSEPLLSCIPLKDNRAMYAHKQVLPANGQIMISSQVHQFKKEEAFLIVDDQKAFYPFEIMWKWVTCAAFIEGELIGINLTQNQSTDPEKYNENAIWINGRVELLPAVTFELGATEWRIRDSEGLVNLTFVPRLQNTMSEELFYVKSLYKGPFGELTGTIQTKDRLIELKQVFGMGEDFYLRA